jgi:GNAT superfamily N-acetyltransferase
MSISIELAGPDRVDDLAALLGRSFVDDPMIVWPIGPDQLDRATSMFRIFNGGYVGRGWLWEAGSGLGVAAWLPPGYENEMMDLDRAVRPLLGDDGGRQGEFWDWIAENFPREPFWYLDYIAVDAERRGSGVGTALIEHGLAFARRDGTPAFLETGRSGNVPYYERRGFRTYLDEDAPNGGPHIWFMRFDP